MLIVGYDAKKLADKQTRVAERPRMSAARKHPMQTNMVDTRNDGTHGIEDSDAL